MIAPHRRTCTIHAVKANNAWLATRDIEIDMFVAIDHVTGEAIDGDVDELPLRQRVTDSGWQWEHDEVVR